MAEKPEKYDGSKGSLETQKDDLYILLNWHPEKNDLGCQVNVFGKGRLFTRIDYGHPATTKDFIKNILKGSERNALRERLGLTEDEMVAIDDLADQLSELEE